MRNESNAWQRAKTSCAGGVVATKQILAGETSVNVAVDQTTGQGRAPALWPSVGEFPIYDDLLYHVMNSDKRRNSRYRDSIKKMVSGKTVVDIGTGQDINWARACAEAGATRVFAIEEIEKSFEKATERIFELGFQDRIFPILGTALEVELPEKVDACVSELIGTIGSSEGVCAILDDAKMRFLKPNPIMIPQRCVTRIAATTLPETLHANPGFGLLPMDYVERILKHLGRPFDVRLCLQNVHPANLLSEPGVFEDLDFEAEIRTQTKFDVELSIGRAGRLDGFLLWINLECEREGPRIDSLFESTNWAPVFLPVFYPGVSVQRGDTIEISCIAALSDDGVHPDYRVEGILSAGGKETDFRLDTSHHGTEFRNSLLYEALFPKD